LPGCENSLFDPKGPVAAAQSIILVDAMVIMLAIIGPTMVATLVFAWWYRASNTKALYRPNWAFSGRIELVVWTVPLLTITFLSGICWIGSHQLDPATPLASDRKPLEVQVVSLDWKWLFIYPEQNVAAVNQLVVPAGVPVHLRLTSGSVWNAFFVPRIGSMIYTMKGMATQLHLMADAEGSFHGLSAQFSGDGFSDMRFEMRSTTQAAFDEWISTARGSGPALDQDAYAELARQSTANPPRTWSAVMPSLFEQIVTAKAPAAPGPGPGPGTAPADVRPSGGHTHAR
jgi:cytochrome o ubiquinol oxidase subunit 2